MKRWPALDLAIAVQSPETPPGWQDLLSAALDDLRPTAIQEHDASWRVFFGSAADRNRAAGELPSAAGPWLAVSPVDVDDEDWARRSQETLHPVRVGRVVMTPPWAVSPDPAPNTLEVVILPSMGFGTGHHASTRLCAGLLQELDLRGRRVLDVGTGSGVLALVSWRLGANPVVGVDDDEDAIRSAEDNLALNGAVGQIQLQQADFRQLSSIPADIVTANLTGALLARSAGMLSAAVRPGGSLIVSGVTLEEEPTVVEAFQPHVTLALRQEDAGWVGLLFAKGRQEQA